jgi:Fe-S cluster biosynthesis and repair protein YggX
MDKFLFNDYRANDIFDEFTEEKVAERYELLFKETTLFIKENNLENKASVNKRILADVVLDYFYDTKIKKFSC